MDSPFEQATFPVICGPTEEGAGLQCVTEQSDKIARMRLRGSTMDLMPEPPRCAYPGCLAWGAHNHHITYDPEVKKWLCVRHHEEITILNGQQGRKYGRGLSNKHRGRIWYQWTQGKLKVRRTRLSLEWIEEWEQRRPKTLPTDAPAPPQKQPPRSVPEP